MATTTKAIREFEALSTREKLDYDPSGRPGAAQIRERQEALRKRKEELHEQLMDKSTRGRLDVKSHRLEGDFFGTAWSRPLTLKTRDDWQRWRERVAANRSPILNEYRWMPDRAEAVRKSLELRRLREAAGTTKINHVYGTAWYWAQIEDEEVDHHRYSKAYHRKYGPSRTISNRRVVFVRLWGQGVRTQTVYFDGWRGDWLARAKKEAGIK